MGLCLFLRKRECATVVCVIGDNFLTGTVSFYASLFLDILGFVEGTFGIICIIGIGNQLRAERLRIDRIGGHMVRLAHLVNRVHDLECLREDDQEKISCETSLVSTSPPGRCPNSTNTKNNVG